MLRSASLQHPPRDPRLVELLCCSYAADCMRDHVDRLSLRIKIEGQTDYLVDELFRSDRLDVDDYRDGSRIALLARAWNGCPLWVRRGLVVQYLACRSGIEVPPDTVRNAHAVWRNAVDQSRWQASFDLQRRRSRAEGASVR